MGWQDALHVRDRLHEALGPGIPVTAAVPWLGGPPLYRLLWTENVRHRDFRSTVSKQGFHVERSNPVLLDLGISMFSTPSEARKRCLKGGFLAAVQISGDTGTQVMVAKTLVDNHYTVWGDPLILAAGAEVIERIPSRIPR